MNRVADETARTSTAYVMRYNARSAHKIDQSDDPYADQGGEPHIIR